MAETVTIGLRDARLAQDEQNEEWDRALDAARKAEKAVRRATSGPSMQFWITGGLPLFLDFEELRERQRQRGFGGGRASGSGGGGASF